MAEATNLQLTREERVREREDEDTVKEEISDGDTREHETERSSQGGVESSDVQSSLLPSSQGELRMKRLQHLEK